MDEHSPSGPTDGFDDVRRRLAALGTTPLDPGVAERTQARLQRARSSARPLIPRKLVLVAATVGFVLGGVGLAAADTLPDPVQEVAHHALAKVGLHVPPGHDRYNDPAVCPGGPYKNHGEYVRAHKDDPTAAESPCGKPVKSVTNGGDATTEDDADDDIETGPPPWAHGNKDRSDKAGKEGNGENRGNNREDDGQAPHDTDSGNSSERPEAPTTSTAPTTTAPSATTTPDDATTVPTSPSTSTTSVPS